MSPVTTTPPIRFEHPAVVICQCVAPCRLPFRTEEGQWHGCALPAGHPGDEHSLDGPGVMDYRTETVGYGPRVVLRPAPGDVLAGECHRCHATYSLSMTAVALPVEERMALTASALTDAATGKVSHG